MKVVLNFVSINIERYFHALHVNIVEIKKQLRINYFPVIFYLAKLEKVNNPQNLVGLQ